MNPITNQNKIAYNYLAETYAKEWSEKPDVQLANTFISFLLPNTQILDVGCGPGHYSRYFYEHGLQVVGIDFSENMISIAKKLCDKVDFYIQDMQNLEFKNNEFDALWVCSSFVHIPTEQTAQVLKEFKRVLKDEGILFINVVIGNLPYRLETEDEIGGPYKGNGRYFQWYPDSASFIKILNDAGFCVEQIYSKEITSHVVENAKLRTNKWFNYICKSKIK